jgi:hypothetical protein
MAPARAADAPPGYYLLFVINDQNVPSIAKIVRMNVAANPNPAADHHADDRRSRRHALRTGLQCQRDPRRHRGTLGLVRRPGRSAVHPPRFDRSLDRHPVTRDRRAARAAAVHEDLRALTPP